MRIERVCALAEELLVRPFPAERSTTRTDDGPITSGPGFHIVVVAASDDFEDDHDATRSTAAWEDMLTVHTELIEALSTAWGPPRLEAEEVDPNDYGPLEAELLYSFGLGGGSSGWVHGDRLCCTAISQVGSELPFELVVGVGVGRSPLSQFEAHFLEVAADGAAVEAIAQRAQLSSGMVRDYLSSAVGKVGATDRSEALRIARSYGWIRPTFRTALRRVVQERTLDILTSTLDT
jgi:DNA-binding CsgD family transcriptional regulator